MMAIYPVVDFSAVLKKSEKFHAVKIAKPKVVIEIIKVLFDIIVDE